MIFLVPSSQMCGWGKIGKDMGTGATMPRADMTIEAD